MDISHYSKRNKVLPPISSKSPIYAAALQDHFAKSLSISSKSLNKSASYKPILNAQKRQLAKWTRQVHKCGKKKENGKSIISDQLCIGDLLEREKVLDPPPKPLSLAQKLGIVDRPKDRLTDAEWKEVKAKSKARSTERCPICCDHFTNQDQILLSCSHVYHRACLESYEKHANVLKRICPMCRTEGYEKRLSFDGKISFYNSCAVKYLCLQC